MNFKNNKWVKKIVFKKCTADAAIEIKHLKGNVQSLRDALEKQQIGEETNIQKAEADTNIENKTPSKKCSIAKS